MAKEYNIEMQTLFLRMMVTDAELYTRVTNIMNPENFDRRIKPVAEFMVEHCSKYATMPEPTQIKASTGIDIDPIPELESGHHDWFLEEFETFTRRQELERAILKSADLLEKGDFDPVEKLIKDAVQISLQRDMGTDYFADPRARLIALKSNNGQNSTGWPNVDKKLYGGFNRGELQIFAGGSGSGKSLFLQNLAVNWSQAGLNGAYITLELNEGLCSMRIDSMMTDISTRDIFKDIDNVELKVKMMAKKAGNLRIKYMPAQSTVNDIRAYCKELQIQTGVRLDFLCVDYLDLLMPVSVKVSPSDLFVKDKFVSEELRNLAKELNLLFVTASQLNRCLALDTLVEVNSRKVRIDTVKVGDYLTSNEGPVKVLEVLPVTTQPVFEITLKSGKKIKCSAKHKFPTPNGTKTIETGLAVGDKMQILRSRAK